MEILDKDQERRRYIRSIAKQVVRECRDIERNTGIRYRSWLKAGLVGVVLIGAVAFFSGCCAASEAHNKITVMFRPNCLPIIGHTCSELADAIYKAENSKNHTYGIMTKYRHTDPRTACINTIHHQIRNWLATDQREGFLAYLAEHYAPVNAGNDPRGLNVNWKSNVEYYLKRG